MTLPSRSLQNVAVLIGLEAQSTLILAYAMTKRYVEDLAVQNEETLNREAATAAAAICQERMMKGHYANDPDAMARDLESETELHKMLRKKQ